MGHNVNGFIAPIGSLESAIAGWPDAVVCQLDGEYVFLPVLESMVDPEEAASQLDAFSGLTRKLEAWAVDRSLNHPIAYIETDYFGGTGGQAAVVWKGGRIVLGPLSTHDRSDKPRVPLLDHAINECLRFLGVSRAGCRDEFEALGLGCYRSNDDWIRSAWQPPG